MARVTLFYDADCGFCQSSVEWMLRQARPGTFDPVAYQDDEGMRKFPMVDRTLADKGIQALGEDGQVRSKARASGYCLTFMPRWAWAGHFILSHCFYLLRRSATRLWPQIGREYRGGWEGHRVGFLLGLEKRSKRSEPLTGANYTVPAMSAPGALARAGGEGQESVLLQ